MTWTYTVTDLATSQKDQVRNLIGDVDASDEQLQDEEITQVLADEGAVYRASVTCCEIVAARYARRVDYTLGKDIAQSNSQKAQAYYALAAALRRKMARSNSGIYIGGRSLAEKDADRQDDDLVQPLFAKEMQTEPGTEVANPDSEYPEPAPP